ncbi:PREDICTED: rasGAP-activating-like protein 1 [Dipodomys ordii]|uniref:RasGAP-activating-like protein 1 n=1 Tax=Dipodomys ordii TaxID=10020 RepID=A0A1S3GWT4_DIPOR|nr:PREDICTED: rasGAP-activating-like protein 1 [Dipodomys ordii]
MASPLALLEELSSGDCGRDLATRLVKLFLGRGLAGNFLDYVTRRELARTADPNVLFRSNSLASKSMEQFMKLVGMHYLHEVLRPIISRVFEEKKYMELDPCKMDLSRARRISFKGVPSEEQVRETSLGLLTGYLGPIVDAIVGSVGRCPLALRLAFKQLRRRVEERFPGAGHERAPHVPSAAGCSRTHSAVTLGDWSDPLDPDAETQAVYRQLLLGRDQLRMKFLEDLNPDLVPEADAGKDPGTTDRPPPEVLARQRAAAAHLLQVLEDLDRAHEEFLLRL